jgi:hypothetical protein
MPLTEPAVSRRTLVLTAASLWSLAGLILILRAAFWLPEAGLWAIGLCVAAIGVGLLKGWLVFAKIARKNVERIRSLAPQKPKICVFAFQAIQSYLIVIAMIALGILLRMSPIPRLWLAAIYLAIGAALEWSSLVYWKSGIAGI